MKVTLKTSYKFNRTNSVRDILGHKFPRSEMVFILRENNPLSREIEYDCWVYPVNRNVGKVIYHKDIERGQWEQKGNAGLNKKDLLAVADFIWRLEKYYNEGRG